MLDQVHRMRRNRRNESIRSLVRETSLTPSDFIYPLFICEGRKKKEAIGSMPGQFRYSLDMLPAVIKELHSLGILGVALFPAISSRRKNRLASEAINSKGLVPQAIHTVKSTEPQMIVITDVALDPFNSDGHDGLVGKAGEIQNDATVAVLQQMALMHATTGADYVAPSDMMDGRIGAIRKALDKGGYASTGIISYAAKYASAFYGPFRDALASAPKAGDKKTYQMDPANRIEALREVALDIEEGADIVMIKPAMSYLDIIREVRDTFDVPVAAYQVSGEYSMIHAAASQGWLDLDQCMLESLLSIKRAGAKTIFSYFAPAAARLL